MAWKFGSTKRKILWMAYSQAMWLKELDLVEICPPQKKGNGGEEKKLPHPTLSSSFLRFRLFQAVCWFLLVFPQCLIQTSLKFLGHCLICLHWGFSKYVPWTTFIRITWAAYWTWKFLLPFLTRYGEQNCKSSNLYFNNPPGDFYVKILNH